MKNRKFYLILFLGLIAIITIVFGFGIFIEFIKEIYGDNWLIYPLLILGLVGFIYWINDELKVERKNKKDTSELFNIGLLIFQNHKEEFETFYSLFQKDKKKFISQNELLDYDFNTLKPIDVLYLFAESKKLVHIIDWRGEENEMEIEEFIENNIIKQAHNWTNSTNLRNSISLDKQRDGKFIVDLFKAINKDLKSISQKLLFFELGSDVYTFTTVDFITFDEIIKKSPNYFHGSNKLRK